MIYINTTVRGYIMINDDILCTKYIYPIPVFVLEKETL